MTQNKYHVVTAEPEFTYNTLEEAEKIAKELIEEAPYKEFHLVRVIKNYKMVTNLIETDLTAPENDFVELSEQAKPKFKVGDLVSYNGNLWYVYSIRDKLGIKSVDSYFSDYCGPTFVDYEEVVEMASPKTLKEHLLMAKKL